MFRVNRLHSAIIMRNLQWGGSGELSKIESKLILCTFNNRFNASGRQLAVCPIKMPRLYDVNHEDVM